MSAEEFYSLILIIIGMPLAFIISGVIAVTLDHFDKNNRK